MSPLAGAFFNIGAFMCYIIVSVHPIPEMIRKLQKNGKNKKVHKIGKEFINLGGLRLTTFAQKGTTCVSCGLKAIYFGVSRMPNASSYHLNLFGIKENKIILFTKDHKIPKSRGGKDRLKNMQTMCAPCNSKKGDRRRYES